MNETFKSMMVLRPYQYFATEAIIRQVEAPVMRTVTSGIPPVREKH
jgi:hypothetical protein